MSRASLRFLGIGLLSCLALGLGLNGGRSVGGDAPATPVQVGRYHPFNTTLKGDQDAGECILDTATGKLWVLERDPRGERKPRLQWVLVAEAPK